MRIPFPVDKNRHTEPPDSLNSLEDFGLKHTMRVNRVLAVSMVVWSGMVKMTFTFDEQTAETLRRTASTLKKPQSAVVREAIQDYATRTGRLSEEERVHMLKLFDRMVERIPSRNQKEADAEIAGIRAARRSGGRRSRLE